MRAPPKPRHRYIDHAASGSDLLPVHPSPGKSTPATFHADDPGYRPSLHGLQMTSAATYAVLGHREQAGRSLSTAREKWQPCDVYERADKDLNVARIQADLGGLEVAEQFAAGCGQVSPVWESGRVTYSTGGWAWVGLLRVLYAGGSGVGAVDRVAVGGGRVSGVGPSLGHGRGQ